MGSFDSVTWQALTAVLTVAGLAATAAFWRLRGPVAGLRTLALTLLPAAAYLTGTLRLLWEVGAAVVRWASRLVLSPFVWLGVGLAVTSLLLFVVAGALARRRGRAGEGGQVRTRARQDRDELPRSPSREPARSGGATAASDDDLAEIEAILKRHGIS